MQGGVHSPRPPKAGVGLYPGETLPPPQERSPVHLGEMRPRSQRLRVELCLPVEVTAGACGGAPPANRGSAGVVSKGASRGPRASVAGALTGNWHTNGQEATRPQTQLKGVWPRPRALEPQRWAGRGDGASPGPAPDPPPPESRRPRPAGSHRVEGRGVDDGVAGREGAGGVGEQGAPVLGVVLWGGTRGSAGGSPARPLPAPPPRPGPLSRP